MLASDHVPKHVLVFERHAGSLHLSIEEILEIKFGLNVCHDLLDRGHVRFLLRLRHRLRQLLRHLHSTRLHLYRTP